MPALLCCGRCQGQDPGILWDPVQVFLWQEWHLPRRKTHSIAKWLTKDLPTIFCRQLAKITSSLGSVFLGRVCHLHSQAAVQSLALTWSVGTSDFGGK